MSRVGNVEYVEKRRDAGLRQGEEQEERRREETRDKRHSLRQAD